MKKFRSNWFRVAVEGGTSDKRTIKRSWLEQAAKNFNPATYGARIWLEHIRSVLPDSQFRAYGDVLAVKTEEVQVHGQTKLALFAQVEPTPDLVAMNKAKQKIYTSIEIDDNFADTGEAYIVGLAVTDSPASLGTDVLAFSAQKPEASPFQDRHYSPTSMFTEALETELVFEEIDDVGGQVKGLFSKVRGLLGGLKDKEGKDAALFSELGESIEAVAEHVASQTEAFNAEKTAREKLQSGLDKLSSDFNDLIKKLENTPDSTTSQFSQRPAATGSDGKLVTDC